MAVKLSEWRLKFTENVSSKMQRILSLSKTSEKRFNGISDKVQKLAPSFDKASSSASGLITKVSGVTTKQKQLNVQVDKSKKGFSGLVSGADKLIGTLGTLAAVSFFKDLASESLKLFDIQKKAEAGVINTLNSTGQAAGRTFEQLSKQASALQNVTLFGDEQTLKAQQLLLTFTKVRTEVFDRTIPLAQDLSTVFESDLNSAIVQLGKALNDPIKGINALSRSGISFSESQKNVIKQLVNTNQLAKAQNLILNELETQVGGAARAAAKAGTGALTQFNNTVGDIKEQFGEFVFNILPAFTNTLSPVLTGISNFFNLINSSQVALDIVQSLVVGLGAAAAAFVVYKGATIAATTAQLLLNGAMTANPIGIVILSITALVAAITLLWKRSETFRGVVIGLWEAVKTYFSKIADFGLSIFGGIQDLIVGAFTLDFDQFKSGANKVLGAYKSFGGDLAESFNKGFEKGKKTEGAAAKSRESSLVGSLLGSGGNSTQPLAVNNPDNAVIRQGLQNVSNGGNSIKNVHITFGEIIGIKELNTNEIKEGINDLDRRVLELLTRALAGAEQFSNG